MRISASVIFPGIIALLLAGCGGDRPPTLLFADDFATADNWLQENSEPAEVRAEQGAFDIDSHAGVTVWFKHKLTGPLSIEFDATAVSSGGANDQVSDLNFFWMATNRDGSAPFNGLRNGYFALYDDLLTYYAGVGGNRNTTSRFRRYIGEAGNRPLLPQHDLSSSDALLVPNRKQHMALVADGGHIEVRRDGRVLFSYDDPAPYTAGWFALRTTFSHIRIEKLRIYSLAPESARH